MQAGATRLVLETHHPGSCGRCFPSALFIVCMFGIQKMIVPLAYVFHAIDLGVLGVFGFRGMLPANEAFKDK
jgi:hypothetical protein